MSGSGYGRAYEAGRSPGLGDGRHGAPGGRARSASCWFLGGVLAGLAAGLAMHLAAAW